MEPFRICEQPFPVQGRLAPGAWLRRSARRLVELGLDVGTGDADVVQQVLVAAEQRAAVVAPLHPLEAEFRDGSR